MEEGTLRKVRINLKKNNPVSNNRQYFESIDKEWNEFKVKETSTCQENIFATLEEHSNKIKEFSTRHEKESLRILSKLEAAVLEGREHVFTLLNTEKEHTKGPDIQLTTSKHSQGSLTEFFCYKENIG